MLGISACQAANVNIDDLVNKGENTAAIGAFDLVSPTNQAIVESVETFTWNEAANAETYKLEICSSEQFISNVDTIDYYSRANITATSFSINSSFAFKETNYYWRVTAKNKGGEKVSTSVFSFFVKAPAVEEVEFDLGESDDWQLHPLGSYADVSVDNGNFFGNNEKTLKIAFKEEDTNRGVAESDGWIVVTKTFEKSIYGTDALFFYSFYAGQDATIIIRLVDRDNEYWYCPIQVSLNAKQSVILKFSDFKQRTGDVTVANMTFDFERIKYMEVVFERSFGDGVFLMSGMKAIKFSNYRDFFIDKLNFNDYEESKFVFEAYNFDYKINDNYELEMSYYGTNDLGKPKINGYGFVKVNVNRYMLTGDAIKLSIKYTGNKGTNVILRVYEEDTDRWSFKIPFTTLSTDEYKTLVIPYRAFAASSILGDGKRQFYYILNLQFGLEGEYSQGKLFFKDFEVVNKKDYTETDSRLVGNDGLIENFDNYEFNSEMYFIWDETTSNKDEYMALNSSAKVGGAENPYCGQFEYKADMEAAGYTLPVTVNDTFSSISLWLKDASNKSLDTRVNEVTDYRPDVTIYVRLATKEIYIYRLPSLARSWKEYIMPFADFELTNDDELANPAQAINGKNITHVAIAIQYFYKVNGKAIPVYANNNPVYIDNIYFNNYTTAAIVDKERVITRNGDISIVEDFETYSNTTQMRAVWTDGRTYDYQQAELSNEVASNGGHHSIKMQYKTNDESPAYCMSPAIDDAVEGRGIKVSLKSEKPATVYVNLYLSISGNSFQYRATLTSVADVWTEYTIGFDNFTLVSGSTNTRLNNSNVTSVSRVTFGMVYYSGNVKELAYVYADNVLFDRTIEYDEMSRRTLA